MTKFFVYAHWSKDGGQVVQGFYKADKAAAFAFAKLNDLVAYEERNYANSKPKVRTHLLAQEAPDLYSGKLPAELQTLRQRITDFSGKPIVLTDAMALIDLYEDYCRHVIGSESPLHAIQEIPVVE